MIATVRHSSSRPRRDFGRARIAVLVAALLMAGGASHALDNARDAPPTMRMASDDRAFMKEAAGAGIYEVEVSKVAMQRAQSAEVKKLAAMLVQHHTAANAQLKALAADKSVEIPDVMPDDKKKALAAFSDLNGADFDNAYVREVGIKDHKTDIRHFETSSRSAKDADLKKWAGKTLPTLKQHLAAAEAIKPAGQ